MKLSDFYKLALKFGAENDPRGKRSAYSYADSAVLYGEPETRIKNILVGIDIEVGELLLADAIRKREGMDLVLSHHPEGKAWAQIYEVMKVQVDILEQMGLKRETAQGLLDERMAEVERRLLPNNHTRAQDAARLLDIPLMCAHTPADNCVYSFIARLMAGKKPKTLQGIVDILAQIAEYKIARENSAGPRIISGNPGKDAGKILVEMTGGTEGSKDVYDKLYKSGVRTLICMHLSEEHFKKAKDENLNVIIAGHISSDTLGLNLLLDRIEKHAKTEFRTVCCSGFQRIRR